MALPIILAAGAWGATKFGGGVVKGVAGGVAKGAVGATKGVAGVAFNATKFIASLPKKIISTMLNGPAKILGFLGKIIGKPLGLLGISTSVSSLLRQSQIFTGSVGALLQIVGAFIDIMIAPFMPYFASLMKKMGTWIPKIQEFSLKFHEFVVNTVFPWVKGLPEAIVGHFGFKWSDITTWWDNQTWRDWMDDPWGNIERLWGQINWTDIANKVFPTLKDDITTAFSSAMETFGTVSDIIKDIMLGKKTEAGAFDWKNPPKPDREGGVLAVIKDWWKNIDWDLTATTFLTAIGVSDANITEIKRMWAELVTKWGVFTEWWNEINWTDIWAKLTTAMGAAKKAVEAITPYILWIARKFGLLPEEKIEGATRGHRMAMEEYAERKWEQGQPLQLMAQGDQEIWNWFKGLFSGSENKMTPELSQQNFPTVDQVRMGTAAGPYTVTQGYADLEPNLAAAYIKNKKDETQAVIDTTNALKALTAELTPVGRMEYRIEKQQAQEVQELERSQKKQVTRSRDEDWEIRAAAQAGHY